MRCINCCNSLFLPIKSVSKHKNQQPCITKLPLFTYNTRITSINEFFNYNQNFCCLKTKAISGTTSSLITEITAKPVDMTVFLTTSAVFLFIYWIANFVVPDLLIKDLQSDKTDRDQKFDDDE